ncbi:MAG: glycosyltransferase family 2 protein [Verrucomicrobiota bacterium]
MKPAPIALFTYNRLAHTRKTVEALASNELANLSDLYVFSDGAKSEIDQGEVDAVRQYLRNIRGFYSVHVTEQPNNIGLSQSIIRGVSQVCEEQGRVIVLEDDLVTSPYFLRYMNDALNLYEDEPDVVSIHGYIYPTTSPLPETFFLKGADCWGWATWKRGWRIFNPDGAALLRELVTNELTDEFDFNNAYPYTQMLRDQLSGKVDSWAIRWYASAFLKNMLTLYPGKSLVQNIGHDGTGRHCGPSDEFEVRLARKPVQFHPLAIAEDLFARRIVERYFRSLGRPTLAKRVQRKLRRIWQRTTAARPA